MKKLVIFSGLPGTGKSTLADRLARELCLPLLCIDDVIGEIPANPGVEFWDSRVAVLLDVVERQLKVGIDAVVDSVFMNMDRHHAQGLARKYGYRLLPVYVYVSDEAVWRHRVETRVEELGNPDVATWESIQHQRGHFRVWEPGTALFIDSLGALDGNFAKVLEFVLGEGTDLLPLVEIPLSAGRYHQ